jgi:hypothetical protein
MTHINTYLLPAHHSPKLPARPTRRWHDHKTLEPPSNPARFTLLACLLVGETFALLGASGAFRQPVYCTGSCPSPELAQQENSLFDAGYVAKSSFTTNLIAGGTVTGLVGGFGLIALLAVGGPDLATLRPKRSKGALPAAGHPIEAAPRETAKMPTAVSDMGKASRAAPRARPKPAVSEGPERSARPSQTRSPSSNAKRSPRPGDDAPDA